MPEMTIQIRWPRVAIPASRPGCAQTMIKLRLQSWAFARTFAPVAQWTERRPPEPKRTVRVCPGVLTNRRKAVFCYTLPLRDT